MTKAYLRIFGYVVIIVLHLTAITTMLNNAERALSEEELIIINNIKYRFNTIYIQILQVVYAVIGLTYEILTMLGKDDKTIKKLREQSNRLLNDFLFPLGTLVIVFFWATYWYNPSFILPISLNSFQQLCPPLCNHSSHTLVFFFPLWELLLQPRPSFEKTNLNMIHGYAVTFVFIMFITYLQHGIWIYPVFDIGYGSIYFYLLFLVCYVITVGAYHLQWHVLDLVWRTRDSNAVKDN